MRSIRRILIYFRTIINIQFYLTLLSYALTVSLEQLVYILVYDLYTQIKFHKLRPFEITPMLAEEINI